MVIYLIHVDEPFGLILKAKICLTFFQTANEEK